MRVFFNLEIEVKEPQVIDYVDEEQEESSEGEEQDEKELVRCLDINDDGNLIVRNENNIIKEIISGEISIRGVKGYV